MKSVERFATNHGIDFDDLAGVQLAEIMKRAAGFITDARTADKINTAVKRLDNLLQVHGGGLLLFNLVATFPKLSTAQLQVINDKFLNGGLDKTSAQVYLAGILASEFGVTLESIKKALALAQKITSRPTRPDSPTGISIRRILTRSHRVQKRRMPRVSGDYLSNLRVSLDYVYTEFEDKASPSTGKYHDWSLSLGGTLAENTDLSYAFVTSNLEDNGTFDTQRGTTLGADFSLIHKLNDNYGLGFYGFYQETDYEGIDQHSIGKGGGLIFTTWHDFDYVDISTVNSLSRAFFDFGQDTIYNGSLSVNRNWTDRISTSIKAMYTDSVVKTSVGDNSYWSFGGEIGILITESVYFALGYTTDVSIKDYENDVWNFHLSYSF
ncbi:MAG: hypothetical protein HRT88_07415 [Lentisphaeraceae bacterium]|nr:hypothetical protein [Lentisphaeraceae bacterium]